MTGITSKSTTLFRCALIAVGLCFCHTRIFAGQGAQRMLYTSPNTHFISVPSGDHAVAVNDTSGSIAGLQAAIDAARAGNPTNVIVITPLSNATYVVSSAGLTLGSQECLAAGAATIQAANSSVTVPLVQIASGATNVSIAGGTFDGNGASINAIYAPAAARVNVDKVIARNCGLDCILLYGQGNSAYDNEMTVTRSDCSGSPAHAGISIQNSTQTALIDNNCHNNAIGIYLSCAWADVANNTCESNSTGIDIAGGDDNVLANNTCNNNGTGIAAAASNNMILSCAMGNNSTAGINSSGSGNTFADNLFAPGNTVNFISGGSGNNVIAYQTPLSAPGQNYFYPPLTDNQHNDTIVNGLGRTDLTIGSTTIDDVQTQYNSARGANPNNVIVLHLNGTFTVGATPLTLQSDTCILLNGTIQINSSTTAAQAVTSGSSPKYISISGGVIDGANRTGHNAIYFTGSSLLQVDGMRLQNFGPDNPRESGSDILRLTSGATPQIVTRCTVTNGAARGIWSENSGVKRVFSDCEVTAVNEDGVDCDASTSESVVKFNYCHDLVRYGVFFEQSASHNVALGNICNNDGRDINVYNNSATPRGSTEYNSALCNCLMGNNGLRNGSTGTNVVTSSHNFFFNNVVVNADIESQLYGTQNYYSQNYLAGGALSTAGVESFFNSTDVSSNLYVQDENSLLEVQAQDAATTNSTPIVIGPPSGLDNDKWSLIPTDSGYYRIASKESGLCMNVSGASLSAGAPVIEYPFGAGKNDEWMPMSAGNGSYYLANRLSGLCLDVPGGVSGTQLDQQPYTGAAGQQFNLLLLAPGPVIQPPFFLSASPASQVVLAGQTNSFTLTISTNSGFSGSVSFSLSGLPANTSSNFSPASLDGNGSSTLAIATASNTAPGTYSLTVTAVGSGITNTAPVSLIVNSGLLASPGTLLWTAAGGGLDWSTAQNWTNLTTPGYGPPGISNDVVLGNPATVMASNSVDNVVDSSPAVNSLTFNNTTGFHTTQIGNGATLAIAGGKGVTVGTETDLGTNVEVYDSIAGGGILAVSNPAANLLIRQFTAGATGGIQRGTLDLSGLNQFTMTGRSIEVGNSSATGTARSAGTLYLAENNTLSLALRAQGTTTNAGIDVADNPISNSSQSSFLFLGGQNMIYADGVTVGGGRNIGWLGFNTNFASPSAVFRGTNGNASRVSRWLVGDNSGSNGTGSNSRGTNDFTAGTIDVLVDTMVLGRGESPGMGSGSSTGVVMFASGTLDVNNLQMGVQAVGATGGTTTGTAGTNYFGQMDVDGAATLIVNSNLLMTVTNGGTTGAMNLNAILNVNGGTVEATNIVGGSGASTINLNSGTLDLRGSGQITNVTALNIGDGVSSPAQLLNAAAIESPNAITVAANGTLAGNTVVTTPNLFVSGTLSPGAGGIGRMTAAANVSLGAGGNLVLAVQDAGGNGGFGWDFLQVNGQLNVAATNTNPFTILLQSFDPNGSGTVTNFSADTNYDWAMAAGGGIVNFGADKFAVDTTEFQNDMEGGYFYVRTNGSSLVVSFTNNHPPFAAPYVLYQTPGGIVIPISNLASNWSDPDGDPVALSDVNGASTNGIAVSFDGQFIHYTNATDVADAFYYSVEDVRTNPPAVYRSSDTQRTAIGEIIFLPPPLAAVAINGTNLMFGWSGGIAGRPFYLLGTTNVALPINQWPGLATNSFDGNGDFSFTNSISPGTGQQFYILQLQ